MGTFFEKFQNCAHELRLFIPGTTEKAQHLPRVKQRFHDEKVVQKQISNETENSTNPSLPHFLVPCGVLSGLLMRTKLVKCWLASGND